MGHRDCADVLLLLCSETGERGDVGAGERISSCPHARPWPLPTLEGERGEQPHMHQQAWSLTQRDHGAANGRVEEAGSVHAVWVLVQQSRQVTKGGNFHETETVEAGTLPDQSLRPNNNNTVETWTFKNLLLNHIWVKVELQMQIAEFF